MSSQYPGVTAQIVPEIRHIIPFGCKEPVGTYALVKWLFLNAELTYLKDELNHYYNSRRDVRVVEGACLESMYTVIPYRGFESLSLRQFTKRRGFSG